MGRRQKKKQNQQAAPGRLRRGLLLLGVGALSVAVAAALVVPSLFETDPQSGPSESQATAQSDIHDAASSHHGAGAIPHSKVHLQKPAPLAEGYVGSETCAECHDDIAEAYRHHPMGMDNFSLVADASEIEALDGENCPLPGPRRYRVEKNDDGVFHHETLLDEDGEVIFDHAHKIAYTVGSGQQGRSYLVDHGGVLYQSPLTWYVKNKVWGYSPGFPNPQPPQWTRRIGEDCLRCHVGLEATHEPDSDRYSRPAYHEMFISCERCHGPGEEHVALNQDEETTAGIVNPEHLSPRARDSVCYQCHLSAKTVVPRSGYELRDFRPGQKLEDALMILVEKSDDSEEQNRIASQAEQMEMSRCYVASNGQLGCISCHDPHSRPTLEERDTYYQDRCIACHQEGPESCALPVAQQLVEPAAGSCVHCHMPTAPAKRIGHISLSDHRILREPVATIPEAKSSESSVDNMVIFAEDESSLPQRERDRAYGSLYAASAESARDPLLERARKRLLPEGYHDDSKFEAALETIGDDVQVLRELGFVYAMQGRLDRAIDCNLRGLKYAPTDDKLLLSLVDGYARSRQPDKALEYLEKLREVSPYLAKTYKSRAQLLRIAGQEDAAIAAAEESLQRDPLNGRQRGLLIQLYKQSGQIERARQHRQLHERLLKAMGVESSRPTQQTPQQQLPD